MNPNQFYGAQPNYLPMQNAQPYYQPSVMNTRPPDPTPVPPQMNHVQFNQNQPMMSPPAPLHQYNPPQFQYGNNQPVNYPTGTSSMQIAPQFQPNPQNTVPNQVNISHPQLQQNYQYSQPNPASFYSNATSNQNIPSSNQYGGPVNNPNVHNPAAPVQNNYIPPMSNQGNLINSQIPDSQQMSQAASPNVNNSQPTQKVDTPSTSNNEPPPQYKEPTLQKVQSFKPTNVVGDYKCSDFPNLFTGPFRYSSPAQRKPFTMKGDPTRPTSQPSPMNSERRTQIGLTRHAKRWELRGGKYYGCFTSRTNGLQDNCPKARCKLCPTDKKK